MPTSGEIIEKLTRKICQFIFLDDLKECETLEDFQKLTEKYKTLCENQN